MTPAQVTESLFDTSIVSAMVADVERFQREILDFPIPAKPRFLSGDLFGDRLRHLDEEMLEFQTAHSIEGQADGLIDLIYVALGALIQMGICPQAVFDEVHAANMRKHRGTVAHRPLTAGQDAEKPENWTSPDITKMLSITKVDIDWMTANRVRQVDIVGEIFNPQSLGPRILVIGHAQHGKDTVSELLRDKYGFSFTSSSMFCAEHVILKGINDHRNPELGALIGKYKDALECYDDRGNHRALWYDTIRDFNRPDLTTLGRAIFDEYKIYCGLRHHSEFHALKNAGVFDVCIWVDAQDRLQPEDASSCTVEPWMADFVLDNNGTRQDLGENLESLMRTIMKEWLNV